MSRPVISLRLCTCFKQVLLRLSCGGLHAFLGTSMLGYFCFMIYGLIFLTGLEQINLLKGKSYSVCLARGRVDLRMGVEFHAFGLLC